MLLTTWPAILIGHPIGFPLHLRVNNGWIDRLQVIPETEPQPVGKLTPAIRRCNVVSRPGLHAAVASLHRCTRQVLCPNRKKGAREVPLVMRVEWHIAERPKCPERFVAFAEFLNDVIVIEYHRLIHHLSPDSDGLRRRCACPHALTVTVYEHVIRSRRNQRLDETERRALPVWCIRG